MGRKKLISMTAINRYASQYKAIQNKKYKENLISNLDNGPAKLPEEYDLYKVDFDELTRLTNITFECTQKYRTIERYITHNYVKYPVYSEWKCKKKLINKKVKLTNDVLENLDKYDDKLIKNFAVEIIAALNSSDVIPSWLKKMYIRKNYNTSIDQLKANKKDIYSKFAFSKKTVEEKLSELENRKKLNAEDIDKLNSEIIYIKEKRESVNVSKYQVLISIFTLSICSRKRRLKRLLLKEEKLSEKLRLSNDIQFSLNKEINDINLELEKVKEKHLLDIKKIDAQINKLSQECNYKITLVNPLPVNVDDESDFMSLKQFKGLKYEKIIGCYVIKNCEKYKCYVGQSKDIFRRLNQHFKGTQPKNIIFAEDYYTSKYENKDELFEVKIIKCQSKDELDKKEKELIELYDSFNNGYNGTNGNL